MTKPQPLPPTERPFPNEDLPGQGLPAGIPDNPDLPGTGVPVDRPGDAPYPAPTRPLPM